MRANVTRQDLKVPFEFAPRYHWEIWHAFQKHIFMKELVPALTARLPPDHARRLVQKDTSFKY